MTHAFFAYLWYDWTRKSLNMWACLPCNWTDPRTNYNNLSKTQGVVTCMLTVLIGHWSLTRLPWLIYIFTNNVFLTVWLKQEAPALTSWPNCSAQRWPPTFYHIWKGMGSKLTVLGTAGITVTSLPLSHLPEVLPLPLQNHLLVALHMTTADGSWIPQ